MSAKIWIFGLGKSLPSVTKTDYPTEIKLDIIDRRGCQKTVFEP